MHGTAGDLSEGVKDFLEESRENLDRVDVDLVALEQHPDAVDIVARVFRTVHTVKGTCSFLGFSRLESLAHAGENVLASLRAGEIAPTRELTSLLLRTVDAIRQLLSHIAATGGEGDADHAALVAELTAVYRAAARNRPGGEGAEPRASRTLPIVAAAPTPADSTVRVDVGLLDRLMNLVGELVIARNQILQVERGAGGDLKVSAAQHLDLITSELQQEVMKTRMQPIGNVWNKLPRVVRDLAVACEKRVRLELEGAETELDRTLIEAIKDPLTHLVRNAVDHGIEAPVARIAARKPVEGRVRLRAFHEGGQVVVDVSDDGVGLDPEVIRLRAIERGLTTAELTARMSERELLRLTFLPGFSTAAKVTHVSGRGVGMDVVLTNIERIGGSVELSSRRGAGTTVKLKLPLTLAIVSGVIVTSGASRYVIPQANILELLRLDGAEAGRTIEMLHGAPVYRLRGRLLPLVYLCEALGEPRAAAAEVVSIVVLTADDRQLGLVVDAVHDTEEIVVKSLGKHLKGTAIFAGATIMGDGRVALILDVVGLAKRAGVLGDGAEGAAEDRPPAAADGETARQTLLLFRSPGDGRMAIPLSRVARLEELARGVVEEAGPERLVQYRGALMPLVDLGSVLVERRSPERLARTPPPERDTVQVVVIADPRGPVGLAVEEIVDIVEGDLGQCRPGGRAGVLGAVVVQGRVTELLDVEVVLRQAQRGAAGGDRDGE